MRDNYLESLKKYINSKISNKIIIDKMPLNIVHVGEIIKIFPNAKFILAIRHPCDCVLSCFMQNFGASDAMARLRARSPSPMRMKARVPGLPRLTVG